MPVVPEGEISVAAAAGESVGENTDAILSGAAVVLIALVNVEIASCSPAVSWPELNTTRAGTPSSDGNLVDFRAKAVTDSAFGGRNSLCSPLVTSDRAGAIEKPPPIIRSHSNIAIPAPLILDELNNRDCIM